MASEPALRALLIAGCCLAGGCAAAADPLPVDPLPDAPGPLPTLRVEQIRGGAAEPEPFVYGLAGREGNEVTLTAVDTELRLLLPALAEAAGVSLVLGPEVQGRVSVRLDRVPALEALEQVLAAGGLALRAPLSAPWAPTVFYTVPVNIDEADVATIQGVYGVSAELARFIVQSRIPR